MTEFMQEYGLLIAVALPPTVIVCMNVYLALTGERGTLLLPSSAPLPGVRPYEMERFLEQKQPEDLEPVAEEPAGLRKAA